MIEATDTLRAALAKCNYPDCVDNGPEGKCTRWLLAECEKSEDYNPQREPLTDEAVQQLYAACLTSTHHIKDLHGGAFGWLVRIIERAHGIGGEYERLP